MEELKIMSFDTAVGIDEKQEELEVKKILKKDQIETSIKNLKLDIARGNQKLNKSIINPDIDSVNILMDLDVMAKKLEYNRKVLTLFSQQKKLKNNSIR